MEPLRVANVCQVVPTMTSRHQALLQLPIVAMPPNGVVWFLRWLSRRFSCRPSYRFRCLVGRTLSTSEQHPPTKQSPLQGGAGSNCEHGARNEAEGAPIPGSRQNSPESSPRRNAREEDKDAPVAPRRSSRQARVGLAAAALEAADGAAEDNDDARKGSGGSKKGGKENATPKPKPKPKPKKGKDEELFPDEGEEDGDN